MFPFDLDFSKIMVFAIIAIAVIPPKDLPRVLRTVGQTIGKMRRMAAEFQGQFMDALKEADLDSVKKELADMEKAARVEMAFDPVADIKKEIEPLIDVAATPSPANVIAPPHLAEAHAPQVPAAAPEETPAK